MEAAAANVAVATGTLVVACGMLAAAAGGVGGPRGAAGMLCAVWVARRAVFLGVGLPRSAIAASSNGGGGERENG